MKKNPEPSIHQISIRAFNQLTDVPGSTFSYDELCNLIISGGGILRFSTCLTVREYLESMEGLVIEYHKEDDRYHVLDWRKRLADSQVIASKVLA